MHITLKGEANQLSSDLRKINKKAIPKALTQAINRTVTGVRTDSKRALSKDTGIKQKDVDKELKIFKASKTTLTAKINSRTGRARNLINYIKEDKRNPEAFRERTKRGKYKNKGVRAKAWGKTKTYQGTFIGKGRGSNKPLVFARTSSKRTPIKSIQGPSIRSTFNKPWMQDLMIRSSRERFTKAFTATTKNEIRKTLRRRV